MANTDEKAFPSGPTWTDRGMTLRDYFAGQALTTFNEDDGMDVSCIADWCYRMADAMMEAHKYGE